MQTIEAPGRLQNKHGSSFEQSDTHNLLLIVGSCALLFFAGLWTWGFIDPGDGYFSEAAREMIERGDYIVPHLNYQIYFSKPILIFWLIIGSYKIFGINEFAARFSSAALATAASIVCYWCGRTIFNRRTGLIAALVLSASPLVVTFARMSLIDMGFASLLGIALMSSAMTLFANTARWWPVAYIALALAVLDKGPAAIVLYMLGMVAYLIAVRPAKTELVALVERMHVVPGVLLAAAIALPWYIAVAVATHGLWTHVFFFFENFGRFTGHTNHRNPFLLFYLPVVAYGFFPWALFLPAAWFDPLKKIFNRKPSLSPKEKANVLFACWSIGSIVFFSLSMTKLQTYILPAWPAMAVSTGVLLDRWLDSSVERDSLYIKACGWLMLLTGAICFLAALAVAANVCHLSLIPAHLPIVQLAKEIGISTKLLMTAAFVFGGAGLISSWWHIRQHDFSKALKFLVASMIIAFTTGGIAFYQVGYRLKNADLHCAIWSIKDKPGPVAMFRDFKPSAIFELQRPIDTFFSTDQLHAVSNQASAETQYIIAGPKGAADLLAAYPAQLMTVAHSGDWYVFSSKELVAQRLPTLEKSFTEHIDLSGGEFSWGTLPFAGGTKPNGNL